MSTADTQAVCLDILNAAQDRISALALESTREVMEALALHLNERCSIAYIDGMGTRTFEIQRRFPGKGTRSYILTHGAPPEYYTEGYMEYGYYNSGDRRMKKLFAPLYEQLKFLEYMSQVANMAFEEVYVRGRRDRKPEECEMGKKLLSKAQAIAVRDAMVALNNVCGRAHVRIPHKEFTYIHAVEYVDRTVSIYVGDSVGNNLSAEVERYGGQAVFMNTYGVE